jgi:hypothetical protein
MKYFFHSYKVLLYAAKSYDMGPPALLPFGMKVCGFPSPSKINGLGGV